MNGKVLVTGADGFIGSHLTETLVKKGCKVRAFVFYNSFNSWGWLDYVEESVKNALEVVAGDVRDFHCLQEAVRGCEVVFHLASLISIPYSYQAPQSFVDTNVLGTLNVLQAAKNLGIAKLIHTSTSEVYGTAQFVPMTEDHPLQAQSPYAATKIAADQLALSFYRSYGLPVSVVRPFNTYGPRQSARAIVPTIITQLAAGESALRLGALHPTRDLSYVQDTVEGFIQVAEAANCFGQVVNLGSRFEISIRDLAYMIADICKVDIDILADEKRIRPSGSEVDRLWSDISKVKRLTGWEPFYAGREGLRRGLEETVQWFRESGHLPKYKAEICNI